MKIYKTGDVCPICGQPITLTDPEELRFFSVLVWYLMVEKERVDEVRAIGRKQIEEKGEQRKETGDVPV